MNEPHEIADADAATLFLRRNLLVSGPSSAEILASTLDCMNRLLEATGSTPLPIVVAELIRRFGRMAGPSTRSLHPGVPEPLRRDYAHDVIDRIERSRALDAAAEIVADQPPAERGGVIATAIDRLTRRARLDRFAFSPAAVRALRRSRPTAIDGSGLPSGNTVLEMIDGLTQAVTRFRLTRDLLTPADLDALDDSGRSESLTTRLLRRLTIQAEAAIERCLPRSDRRPPSSWGGSATGFVTIGRRPCGGLTSIASGERLENLLPSQLAYLEAERPDLFDLKFLRGELLHYQRDENPHFARRRTIAFLFESDDAEVRRPDAGLPFPRIVLGLALVRLVARRCRANAAVECLFVEGADGGELGGLKNCVPRTATVRSLPESAIAAQLDQAAKRRALHVCDLRSRPSSLEVDSSIVRFAVAPTAHDASWADIARRLIGDDADA